MEKFILSLQSICLVSLLTAACYTLAAQNEPQNNFTKTRETDFSKLMGANQEGGKLNYNTEKTNLEGSGGHEFKKAHLFIQGTGSVGTTTNLSTLFSQTVLPTFSASITVNYLITPWSTWYFDNTYTRNVSQLNAAGIVAGNISTKNNPASTTEKTVFTYKESFQGKVIAGTFKATDRLYTFKRFFWASATGKYDNSKYAFYNAGMPFADQLSEPHYRAWTGKLTFNSYLFWNKEDINWVRGIHWRPNFIYLNISSQYGLGNNIDQLKKATVNDILTSNTSGTTTRQTVKSQSAYTGTYKEFNTFKPAFEFILSPFRSFALNVFGEYNYINKTDKLKFNINNFGSIATGIYFYGTGKPSAVNIGAYYKWTRDDATNSWTKQIGLKTSIPVTPL
jgi:hypothetical protein